MGGGKRGGSEAANKATPLQAPGEPVGLCFPRAAGMLLSPRPAPHAKRITSGMYPTTRAFYPYFTEGETQPQRGWHSPWVPPWGRVPPVGVCLAGLPVGPWPDSGG